jgi:hypothetical protein
MILAEPLVAYGTVEPLNIRIFLRFSWLNKLDVNPSIFGPCYRRLANELETIVAADHQKSSALLNQLVQRSDDTFSRQREVDLDGQCPAVEIVQHNE